MSGNRLFKNLSVLTTYPRYRFRISTSTTSILSNRRSLSSKSTTDAEITLNAAIDLDSTANIPENHNRNSEAVVILHGLFGSKRNFNTIARSLAESLNLPVYSLDLRNQGSSPHLRPMTYNAMAEDVLKFIQTRQLTNVTLLGHSMGGKVAMATALHPWIEQQDAKSKTPILSNLIVVDIAPTRGKVSSESQMYIKAMREMETMGIKSKREASDFLKQYEPDAGLRAFLLTNIYSISSQHPHVRFRIPLDILEESIPDIGDFPYAPGEKVWNGRTLFIKGSNIPYINKNNKPAIKQFFPKSWIEEIEGGHWVHADQPKAFENVVATFIKGDH